MARIVFISDLHFPGGDAFPILQRASRLRPELLVLAGDLVDQPLPENLRGLARLLRRLGLRVAAVPGNHECYRSRGMIRRGLDSCAALWRARRVLSRGAGVVWLDSLPRGLRVGGTIIAGAPGWWDLSLAPPRYTRRDYENCNPFGASLGDLWACERGVRWRCPPWYRRDCLLVETPVPPERLVEASIRVVERQLRGAPRGLLRVVAYHFVPSRRVLAPAEPPMDFLHGYAGSERLGLAARRLGARIVVYGHVHEASRSPVVEEDGVLMANAYPRGQGLLVLEGGELYRA